MSEAGEILAQKSICVMGNGACPTECPLTVVGRRLFEEAPIGTDLSTMPGEVKQAVLLAGGLTNFINKLSVSEVMSACIKEHPLE